MEKILNEQLERLQIDCIDYYFLHNVDLKAMNRLLKKDVLKFLSKAKQEGKIKYVGFSYHGTTEEFPLLLDAYDWDMVMIQYNYFDNNVQADIEGIHHAASKGIGIFIMEPLKGGILAGKMPDEVESIFKKADPSKTNAEWSISWILNHPEITCVFSGMNNIAQIDENIAIGNSVEPHSMSLEELETIDYAKRALKELLQINCTSCGYCLPCPRGVNIPECMKIYNEKYLFNQKGLLNQSLIDYYLTVSGIMIDSSNAGLCNGCGKCLRKCPQHLDIPKELDKVKNVPLYFVFDMGKEVTVRGVRITARTKAGGVLNNPPGDITIETAKTITGDGMENDADWTYSERFTGTKPDEGIMSHSLHNSVYLGEIQRARYIRFTLHMSWNSGSSVKPTPMTYKGGTFAEFEVWGNLEELDLD